MNQATGISKNLPTPTVDVVAAQMKLRRETLRSLLYTSNSVAGSDTLPATLLERRQHALRAATMNSDPIKNGESNAQSRRQSQHTTAPPNAVASVLGVIGEGLLQGWWQAHPARAAAQVAKSLLNDQARHHPKRLIAVGAAFGSAIVIIKPWRRFNMSKLLLSAVAGSNTGVVAKFFGVDRNDKARDSQLRD